MLYKMLRYKKTFLHRFILNYEREIRLKHNFKNDLISDGIKSHFENNKSLVPENIRSKILYSSYLDDDEFKLGYKRKKIVESLVEKENFSTRYDNVNVRPFLASLRSIGIENEPNKESKNTQIENCEILKVRTESQFPTKWMEDYEYFEGSDVELRDTKYGTPDPMTPISKIPCSGCGALLHCADPSIQGYIPGEIFKGRTELELKTIICQRCHFLKNYNIALDVNLTAEDYVKTISAIQDKFALAIVIVDLLDFPCSIWPDIQIILGKKRPIFIVGNKVDLLPKDSTRYLEHVKRCLKNEVIKSGLNEMNIKHTCLISARTGFGIEELITQLHNIWSHKGDVYLVGCANVGKSSLFNRLLKSDYCKVTASDLVQRATTCPWPGTTLHMLKFPILRPSDIRIYQRYQRLQSEQVQKLAESKLRKDQLRMTGRIEHATLMGRIGMTFKEPLDTQDAFSMAKGVNPILTLDEKSKEFENSKWCYDTPGVLNDEQIHHLLTPNELLLMAPKQMISPRQFKLERNMSLFLAGLGRIDLIDGDINYIKICIYASLNLPILITKTSDANNIYEELLGSELLNVPFGDEERIKRWPNLESAEPIKITNLDCHNGAICDIVLSSAGWLGINLPINKTVEVLISTPGKRGIFVRIPSLIPNGDILCGKKIRGSLAYRLGKPFIRK